MKIFSLYISTLLCLWSCSRKTAAKPDPVAAYVTRQHIRKAISYERPCNASDEHKAAMTLYDADGKETEYESYFAGTVFTHTSQKWENGQLDEKIYHATATNPLTIVRYFYTTNGVKTRYTLYDSLDRVLSNHKIVRKHNVEEIYDYDANGKLSDYRIVVYDSLENPLQLKSTKIRYSYNIDGRITEAASVDTLTGTFTRRIYQYRGMLPVQQTIYYNDTCASVMRYEYYMENGRKW